MQITRKQRNPVAAVGVAPSDEDNNCNNEINFEALMGKGGVRLKVEKDTVDWVMRGEGLVIKVGGVVGD